MSFYSAWHGGLPLRVGIRMFSGFWAGVVIGMLIVRIMERGFGIVLSDDTAGWLMTGSFIVFGVIGLIAGGIRQSRCERIQKDGVLHHAAEKNKQFRKEAAVWVLINLILVAIFIIVK